MLLKIVTGDHLHSQLVDVETGLPVFTTISRSMHAGKPLTGRRGSMSSQSTGSSSSSSTSSYATSWNACPVDRFADGSPIPFQGRHTWILDAHENVTAEIVWHAGYPLAIKLPGQAPCVGELCCAKVFAYMDSQPDVLVAPTRVDDLEWHATKSSMTLIDSDDKVVMEYHPNARVDGSGRVRPAHLLRGEAFLEINENVDYLESVELTELFVTFCLMEIVRRGRFNLTPYVHTHESAGALVRYRVILRDKYIGAAGSKLQQLLGRLRRDKG